MDPSRSLILVLVLLGPSPALRGQEGSPPTASRPPWPQARGKLALELREEEWKARLRSGSPEGGFAGLSLLARDEGLELRGALCREGGESFAAAGPGRPEGALGLLANPASYSASSLCGPPVSIDTSLASGTAVLGAGRRPLSAFALAEGGGSGLLLRREGGEGESFQPRSAAAGLCAGGGTWAAAAALSLRKEREGSGGWEPESPPDPAGLLVLGALCRELGGASGRAFFGLAASLGELEGPGFAARLEADARLAGLYIRLRAALVGPGFRELSGGFPERSLAAAADLRLALKRAAALGLALRLEAPRPDPGEPARFGSSAAAVLSLPLDREGGPLVLAPRFEAAKEAGGGLEYELALACSRRADAGKTRLELGLGLGGEKGLRGAEASLARSAEGSRGLELEFELALSALEGGDPEAPVLADPELRLSFPLASGAELRLEAAGPEGGFALEPLEEAEAAPGFSLSLRYLLAF
ncbi:MAG TPA: hypothetical protein P5142_03165 [Spirochaetia bacterium]|nr:hypothetical protein [Spirochaetia bacterium]